MVASTLADLGDRGGSLEWGGLHGMLSVARLMSLPGPPFSTRSRFHPAAPWPQGFDAAMSRTRSAQTGRRKNRAVVEARPDRDSFRRFSSERVSTDRICSCSPRHRPAECIAGHPHPMQDNSKLTCHRHGSFFASYPFGERLPPALQCAWPRRSTEQNLGRLE